MSIEKKNFYPPVNISNCSIGREPIFLKPIYVLLYSVEGESVLRTEGEMKKRGTFIDEYKNAECRQVPAASAGIFGQGTWNDPVQYQ